MKPEQRREELLPCPFDGNKAVLNQSSERTWFAMCLKCNCEVYGRDNDDGRIWTKGEVIEYWNTRPTPSNEPSEQDITDGQHLFIALGHRLVKRILEANPDEHDIELGLAQIIGERDALKALAKLSKSQPAVPDVGAIVEALEIGLDYAIADGGHKSEDIDKIRQALSDCKQSLIRAFEGGEMCKVPSVDELLILIDRTKVDTQYSSEPESVCIAKAIIAFLKGKNKTI